MNLILLTLLASAAAASGVVEATDDSSCGCKKSRSSLTSLDVNALASPSIPTDGGGDSGDDSCTAPPPSTTTTTPTTSTLTSPPPRVIRLPPGKSVIGTNSPHFKEDAEGPLRAWTLGKPLWADAFEVSNARFSAFTSETMYVSEAHSYGWSFVHELAIPVDARATISQAVQDADWWLPVMNASWQYPEGLQGGGNVMIDGRLHHPAVHVSKRDGDAFCKWAGGRLPRESEWEYAARAGGPAGDLFPWGNDFIQGGRRAKGARATPKRGPNAPPRVFRANTWQGTFPRNNSVADGYAWTSPVDSFGEQNVWGFYNIIGNAWEWTSDVWCPTKKSPRRVTPPDCLRRDPSRLLDAGEVDFIKKGGSFMCHKSSCYRYRIAARHYNSANSGAQNLGFRCFYDKLPQWAEEHVPLSAAASEAS
jgi:sulfatase modifying factor 1